MLQKLRIKFILLTMTLLLLMLTLIIGTINLLNYRHVVYSTDQTLEILLDGGGRFPNNSDINNKLGSHKMSPELPFETRFFTVFLGDDGTVLYTDTGKIAAVTQETALSYATKVWNTQRTKGFIGEYRYAVQKSATEYMIVFVDCSRQLNSANSFMIISVSISLASFVIMSILLYIFSGRIVKPISDSYDKQRQFITNASHDLKTPITVIDADLDILEMDYGENEWLQDIGKQTKRLTELIQELIFLSRMEEKDANFQMIDFPISDVLEETAQSFESLAITQGKTFTTQIQPMLSYCGDSTSIIRLFSILLDNALKYSDDKGNITVSFEKTNHTLKLVVYNTCKLVSTEDINHLFDRFYRGDKSRNSQTGGYGIGLSIAKTIVESHNGTIQASTADEKSLTITTTFPIKQTNSTERVHRKLLPN